MCQTLSHPLYNYSRCRIQQRERNAAASRSLASLSVKLFHSALLMDSVTLPRGSIKSGSWESKSLSSALARSSGTDTWASFSGRTCWRRSGVRWFALSVIALNSYINMRYEHNPMAIFYYFTSWLIHVMWGCPVLSFVQFVENGDGRDAEAAAGEQIGALADTLNRFDGWSSFRRNHQSSTGTERDSLGPEGPYMPSFHTLELSKSR